MKGGFQLVPSNSSSKRPKMKQVKSGIGLSSLVQQSADSTHAESNSIMTSRTARVFLAGAGFLADAYDLFVINLVLRLLREEYPHYIDSGEIHAFEGSVASAALLGSIIGQLVAGSMADVIGRKKIFVITAALITIGCIGASLCNDYKSISVYYSISCWRFILGLGVGGEYPLAATVTSESSSAARRGSLMAAVFAMQGVGALISVFVVIICLELGASRGFAWRFALAFGAVPALLAFPWRLRMHETESFERIKDKRKSKGLDNDVKTYSSNEDTKVENEEEDSVVATRWKEVKHALKFYKYHIIGTALSWFLLDVDFYANGIFNHDVTAIILGSGQGSGSVLRDAWNSAFLCLIGVPGYWLCVFYMESIGRKNVQINGFLAMSVLFLICGVGHDWLLEGGIIRKWLFMILYALTFLFSNFGPNTTTFVIPGEIYPAEVRATCHGVSAASGKLGAAAGAYFFPILINASGENGLKNCMLLCSFVAILGAVVTTFFIPRYSGIELEQEDVYLALEHSCLKPSKEDYGLLDQYGYCLPDQITFEHIIDSTFNYQSTDIDGIDGIELLDHTGALVTDSDTNSDFGNSNHNNHDEKFASTWKHPITNNNLEEV